MKVTPRVTPWGCAADGDGSSTRSGGTSETMSSLPEMEIDGAESEAEKDITKAQGTEASKEKTKRPRPCKGKRKRLPKQMERLVSHIEAQPEIVNQPGFMDLVPGVSDAPEHRARMQNRIRMLAAHTRAQQETDSCSRISAGFTESYAKGIYELISVCKVEEQRRAEEERLLLTSCLQDLSRRVMISESMVQGRLSV